MLDSYDKLNYVMTVLETFPSAPLPLKV